MSYIAGSLARASKLTRKQQGTFQGAVLCHAAEGPAEVRVSLYLPRARRAPLRVQKRRLARPPQLHGSRLPVVGCHWRHWEAVFSKLDGWLQHLQAEILVSVVSKPAPAAEEGCGASSQCTRTEYTSEKAPPRMCFPEDKVLEALGGLQPLLRTCLKLSFPKVFTVSSHSAGAPGTVTHSALPGGSSGPSMPRLLTSCICMLLVGLFKLVIQHLQAQSSHTLRMIW